MSENRKAQMRKYAKERQKLLKEWRTELNDVAESLDVEKFKAFYKKWQGLGIYNDVQLPSDDVLEITVRKMLVNLSTEPSSKHYEAVTWLLERGYDLKI